VGLSAQDIATIVAALQESDWDEAVVEIGDARVSVARNGAGLGAPPAPLVPQPAPVPSAPAPDAASAGERTVTAPTIGVFWSAPEPGAAPFVAVGARIEAGAVLCIVEVMKLMTNVVAPASGTVTAVLVGDGTDVEFGTPLFRIREN
jgi:acetyl-CoA carboxylase biotin carboxyl carrier protein